MRSCLAPAFPVVPAVYPDDETIAGLLADRHAELTVMLESQRALQECDLKVYVDTGKEFAPLA
jgi:uncharacterized metal-binding protein YceD (DUF177 family)